MISLQTITTADTILYNYMEELLITSFPSDEYRDLKELRTYTDRQTAFHNNVILNNGVPIGLLTCWKFNGFYYIEHFAIHPSQRNGGFGKQVLNHIRATMQGPIVLEVERPEEEMARRRIGFYQRQGFVLWEKDYLQPPYKTGDTWLPMYLMAYGNLESEKDFERIRKEIYSNVYSTDIQHIEYSPSR